MKRPATIAQVRQKAMPKSVAAVKVAQAIRSRKKSGSVAARHRAAVKSAGGY